MECPAGPLIRSHDFQNLDFARLHVQRDRAVRRIQRFAREQFRNPLHLLQGRGKILLDYRCMMGYIIRKLNGMEVLR